MREQVCRDCHKVVERNNRVLGMVYTDKGRYVCAKCWDRLLAREERDRK